MAAWLERTMKAVREVRQQYASMAAWLERTMKVLTADTQAVALHVAVLLACTTP
jgi:hypothetical protein